MQIIKRTPEIKENITYNTWSNGGRMQVSFNDYGHISLRFFKSKKDNYPTVCKNCGLLIFKVRDEWCHRETPIHKANTFCAMMGNTPPPEGTPTSELNIAHPSEENDNDTGETLIVLDMGESSDLIRFIQDHVKI